MAVAAGRAQQEAGQPTLRVLRSQLRRLGPSHREGSPFSSFQFSQQILTLSGGPGLF